MQPDGDLPSAANMPEMMLLNNLQEVSSQSLFKIVHNILDDSIENRKEDVPYRVAYLLKTLVQLIEQRNSKQVEELKKSKQVEELKKTMLSGSNPKLRPRIPNKKKTVKKNVKTVIKKAEVYAEEHENITGNQEKVRDDGISCQKCRQKIIPLPTKCFNCTSVQDQFYGSANPDTIRKDGLSDYDLDKSSMKSKQDEIASFGTWKNKISVDSKTKVSETTPNSSTVIGPERFNGVLWRWFKDPENRAHC